MDLPPMPTDFTEPQELSKWLPEEGVRIESWLREEVAVLLEAGGRFHTAIAAGLLLRHVLPPKEGKLTKHNFHIWVARVKAGEFQPERLIPNVCHWIESLTEEDVRQLGLMAEAALNVADCEGPLSQMMEDRDDVAAVRRVLRWLYDRSPDRSRDPLRKLDECIYSWDGLYFPLTWKRSFKDGERVVSSRLVASLAANPEHWWGTPAAATFCADSGMGEVTEEDWKFHLEFSVVIPWETVETGV